jgi:AraC-like DNA-binding protein
LEVLCATYVGQTFSRHTHDNVAIGVVEEGTGAFVYRGTTYVVPAQSIFVIHPGEAHTGGGFGGGLCKYRVMYPGEALLRRMASRDVGEERGFPRISETVIADGPLVRLVHRLLLGLGKTAPLIEHESLMLRAVTRLASMYADGRDAVTPMRREARAVELVRDYLEARYAENVSLSELTTLTGLSAFHLSHVFSQQTGLPPYSYLIQVRVSRAKALLAQGWPIVETALETGFTHQSHLNRHFKRLVGVTPGQYRSASKIVQDTRAADSLP